MDMQPKCVFNKIKKRYHWQKSRPTEQWNRMEIPEADPAETVSCSVTREQRGKKKKKKKRAKNLPKWCWDNWTSTCKEVNLDTDLSPLTKISLNWVTDISVKCKNIHKSQKITWEKT